MDPKLCKHILKLVLLRICNMKFALIKVKKKLPVFGPLDQIVNVTPKRDIIVCSINFMI